VSVAPLHNLLKCSPTYRFEKAWLMAVQVGWTDCRIGVRVDHLDVVTHPEKK
jgi:hypothetical protein